MGEEEKKKEGKKKKTDGKFNGNEERKGHGYIRDRRQGRNRKSI